MQGSERRPQNAPRVVHIRLHHLRYHNRSTKNVDVKYGKVVYTWLQPVSLPMKA